MYVACAQPYCKDVTVDKSLGTIDYDTLLLSDEYIFVQVRETILSSILSMLQFSLNRKDVHFLSCNCLKLQPV